MDDAQLIKRLAKGDEAALNELYKSYAEQIYNFAFRLCRDECAAEDVLQEVFVAAWQHAGSFRGEAKVKTWLLRIAHNLSVSWLRKQHAVIAWDDFDETQARDSGDFMAIVQAEFEPLQKALDCLSPEQRATVELIFEHSLSYQEVAEVMACPLGTVKSRLNAALRCLGRALKRLDI
jgi:RNA polymerase sigma-70 factor (ECF subfamily)